MSNNVVGKWIAFGRQGEKVGVITLESEFKGKKKKYALKVLGADRVDEMEHAFKEHEGHETKATFGLSECREWNGRLFASEPICWNLESAGAEPEPVKEEPTIEREASEPTDEEDSLPF